MTLDRLPKKLQKAVYELTQDEEFQKHFAEDKVLDELTQKLNETRMKYNEAYAKYDQKVCQLVVDWLFKHRDVSFSFLRFKLTNEKMKEVFRNLLIERMKSNSEFLRLEFEDDDE